MATTAQDRFRRPVASAHHVASTPADVRPHVARPSGCREPVSRRRCRVHRRMTRSAVKRTRSSAKTSQSAPRRDGARCWLAARTPGGRVQEF